MYLTIKQKNELIAAVSALLEKMIPVEDEPTTITVSCPLRPDSMLFPGSWTDGISLSQ